MGYRHNEETTLSFPHATTKLCLKTVMLARGLPDPGGRMTEES